MDAGFLNFHKEEDFSSYFLDPCEDDSESYDGIHNTNSNNYQWIEHLDYERELNGDMGLIPTSGEAGFSLSTSPPIKEDFNKIMNDWNNLVSLDVGNELVDDMASTSSTLHIEAVAVPNEEFNIKEEGFDITQYVVGSESDMGTGREFSLLTEKTVTNDGHNTNLGSLGIHVKQEHFDMHMDIVSESSGAVKSINMSVPTSPPKPVSKNVILRPQFGGKRIDMAKGRYMLDESSSEEEGDDEDIAIDVETVEEEEISQPVLQAGDLDSLLEQFEATETTNLELQQHSERVNYNDIKFEETELSLDITVEKVKILSPIKSPLRPKVHPANKNKLDFREPEGITEIKVKTEKGVDIVHSHVKKTNHKHNTKNKGKHKAKKVQDKPHVNDKIEIKLEPQSPRSSPSPQREAHNSFESSLFFDGFQVKVDKIVKSEHSDNVRNNKLKVVSTGETKSHLIKDQRKNKQILDALPVELIDRLRQSNKRKIVPLIEPIAPIKRRHTNHVVKDPITNSPLANRIINSSNSIHKFVSTGVPVKDTKSIQLDHDYCCSTPTKDSGFSSCEEDERSIIRTQPTIKSSNGKLMVSLLKTNTIKKKLNLEEYKKRLQNRGGIGNNSPGAQDYDENTRRLKHTEMLMTLAQDIIKQRNGSLQNVNETIFLSQDQNETVVIKEDIVITQEKIDEDEVQTKVKPRPPRNTVMKTLVSVGTNTEESWGHLEQILQHTQVKISPNSLISSIVEHLPKPVIKSQQVQQGEDKTIVFIDTTKPKAKTCTKIVQTIHSSSHTMFLRRRRRISSSSSYSSNYSDSDCSVDSLQDSCSASPVHRHQLEQLKVVEERRVVYVGRIADSTTKENLRKRFERFGPIINVSVHFRRHDVNYGFVTFMHKEDAYEAVERGNDDADEPQYDLSFGGRRLFCKTRYADLDNVDEDDYEYWSNQSLVGMSEEENNTFDDLLRKAQAKLRNRKL